MGLWLAVDPCPFYAEGGGQVGDRGTLWLSVPRGEGAAAAGEPEWVPLSVCDTARPYEGGVALRVALRAKDTEGQDACWQRVLRAVQGGAEVGWRALPLRARSRPLTARGRRRCGRLWMRSTGHGVQRTTRPHTCSTQPCGECWGIQSCKQAPMWAPRACASTLRTASG